MILHCTKKLYALLPEQAKERAPVVPSIGLQSEWNNWHANVITVQRKQCLIAVHDATRFALFIPGLLKKDWANLDWHFEDVLINTLLKSDIAHELIEVAAANLKPLAFDTTYNRSVQGTMNQISQEIDYDLYYNWPSIKDISPYRYSANLSHRPCNTKDHKNCFWPDKRMAELLTKLAGYEHRTGAYFQ
ncbi:hypothetical protein QTP81_15005 [Alteromonas sp. ASW11-36]|uniref:DUF6933 domain-containing protein n=1 Tax=Alteromonas arenosi TaxID=3055817 RepID=A0ABT7T0E8_9ALTE|nr:hypothetical protein [Alteromonas sp. ASW11-36]MDM7861910.1 hypothetical protein [Alteromonas sp. ASW11-36]